MIKYIILALLLAPIVGDSVTDLSELMKCVFSMTEVAALYYLMNQKPSSGEVKDQYKFQISLGWAACELALNYLVFFIYGALGDERDWNMVL